MAELSDDEFFGAPSAASAGASTVLSDDEFFGAEPAPQPRAFGSLARGFNSLQQTMTMAGREIGMVSDEEAAAAIARDERDKAQYPESEASKAGAQEIADAGKRGWGATFLAVLRNPSFIASTVGESIPQSLAPAVTGITGAIAGGAAGTSVGPVGGTALGAAAGAGSGSFTAEYSSSMLDALNSAGVDLTDEAAVTKALQNPDLISDARQRAVKRGLAVGLFDAMSAGIAGRVAGIVERAASKVGATAAGRVGGEVAELGAQAGTGMAGEAGGQIATEGRVDDIGSVIMEGVAEGVTGLPEIATGRIASRREAGVAAPVATPTQTAPEAVPAGAQSADVLLGADPETTIDPVEQAAEEAGREPEPASAAMAQAAVAALPPEAVQAAEQAGVPIQPQEEPVAPPPPAPKVMSAPAAVPAAPGVAATDIERIDSPRLTDEDRASPIPNSIIDDGKAILEQATQKINADMAVAPTSAASFGTQVSDAAFFAPETVRTPTTLPPIDRRDIKPDVAVTATGREVPVTYAVVEAKSLIASQDDTGRANPAYPTQLQPRDRERAVSQTQINDIAQKLNPRLLDMSPRASDGAPIISEDGVVESGNGRTLAIRQAYNQKLPTGEAYKAHLAQQGYPVEGMQQPVLVRVRQGEMPDMDRQAFTREANERDTLGMSSTERAMADAQAMSPDVLAQYRGGDLDAAVNRDFVRSFMRGVVSANDQAGMVDAAGVMSQDAIRRVQGALLAKAFDDADLVASLIESADTNIKAIGGALMDASAEWAQMRSEAASGAISPEVDATPSLLGAVRLVQRARRDGRNLAEFVGQTDIFSGATVEPRTVAFLALMYRNVDQWTAPVGRDRLAGALRFYTTEARKTSAGVDLLGETAATSSQLLTTAKEKQYGPEVGQTESLFAGPGNAGPGVSAGASSEGRAGSVAQSAEAAPGAGSASGSVAEWVNFPPGSGSLGIPRAEMPQIKTEHRGALVNFLAARGITHEEEAAAPANLKPTQAEYSPAKVLQAQGFVGNDRAILTSSDGHVVDGHHQWIAKGEAGQPVRAIRLNAPIRDLLPIVAEFPSATTAGGVPAPAAAPSPETRKRPQAGAVAAEQASVSTAESPPDRNAVTKRVTLKDGFVADLTFEARKDRPEARNVYAETADGDFIGNVVFDKDGDGAWVAASLFVNKEYQRKGVAMALYDFAEEQGLRLKPETRPGKQSPAAEAMWEKRRKRAAAQAAVPTLKEKLAARRDKATPTPKIDDFGEKIGGARKDMAAEFADRLGDDVDLTTEPLSVIFPQPDYVKLAAEGVDMKSLAMIALAREEIPARPRKSWRVKDWVGKVTILRNFAKSLVDGKTDPDVVRQRMELNRGLATLADTAAVISGLDPAMLPAAAKWKVRSGSYTVFNGERFAKSTTKYTLINGDGRMVMGPDGKAVSADTMEAMTDIARGLMRVALSATKEATTAKRTPLSLFKNTITKDVFIGFKGKSGTIRLKAGFATAAEARAYMKDNADELQAQIDTMRSGFNMRRDVNRPREGVERREGDVTPESFQEAFGFRGVQFGNYVEGDRRQFELNEAFDGLMDLAEVLGVPPRALSLNGTLGLAFGARGRGGAQAAKAHYEPSQVVINLTKAKGAGSLAHEWFHGMDNNFGKRGGAAGTFATDRKGGGTPDVRPEVLAAFGAVRSSLAGGSYSARMEEADAARSTPYWNTMVEKAARGFEKYVVDRLTAMKATNDYLANIDENAGAYPNDKEMQQAGITAAFDKLFTTIETEPTETGVRMFSRRLITETPAFTAWFGDSKVVDADGKPLVVYHGGAGGIEAFDPKLIGSSWDVGDEAGFFFTTGRGEFPGSADDYARRAERNNGSGEIYSVYLSIKNPYTLEKYASDLGATVDGLMYYGGDLQSPIYVFDEGRADIMARVRDGGYDGIIFKHRDLADEALYVAFSPSQIKSVNNRGTFDPADDRILFKQDTAAPADGRVTYTLTPAFKEQAASVAADLRSRLDAMGLTDVAARVFETITATFEGKRYGVGGQYLNRAITVALDAPGTTFDHEALHALRDLALFTPNEWAILERKSNSTWRKQFDIAGNYGDMSEDIQTEEGIAHAYEAWVAGEKMDGILSKSFRKIRSFMEALGNALRGNGFNSVDSIFAGAQSGAIGNRPRDAMGRFVADAANPKGRSGKSMFQAVWHGTPHEFDKFTLDKIGTGEGAQAFGWGLYFTGKKEIAEYYRDKLSSRQRASATWKGEDFAAINARLGALDRDDPAASALWDALEALTFVEGNHTIERALGYMKKTGRGRASTIAWLEKHKDEIKITTPGKLYQVDIPDDSELLVWDKPLSEQPEKVKDALSNLADIDLIQIAEDMFDGDPSSLTGRDLYEWLSGEQEFGFGSDAATSEALRAAGIPGHRYLAGESRSAGEGTYNYVIYDEDAIRIEARFKFTPGEEPQSVEERSKAMQGLIARGQPLDRAMRLPFNLIGGIDASGRWVPGKKLVDFVGRAGMQGGGIGGIVGAGIGTLAAGPVGTVAGAATGGAIGAYLLGANIRKDGRMGWLHSFSENARAGLIDRYGLDEAYQQADMNRANQKRQIMQGASDILQVLKGAGVGTKESAVLQKVLTGEDVTASDMTALAVPIRKAIDDMGAEAVSLGLISAESFERNRGSYLHRVYLKHEVDEGGLSGWVAKSMATKRKKIIGDSMKGRGMFWDVDAARIMQDVASYRDGKRGLPQLGEKFRVIDEVSETGQMLDGDKKAKVLRRIYLPSDEMVPPRYTGPSWQDRGEWEVRKAGKTVTLWRDYTAEERGKMGEIVDARYTIAKTFMNMANDLSTGRFYKDVSENDEWTQSGVPAEPWREADKFRRSWNDPEVAWVKVPDTSIADTGGKKRWGALAGKYVRAEIWRDLNELDVQNNPGAIRKIITMWKKNKTGRNPVVHVNNIMSNMMFMDLADVRVQDLARGVKSFLSGDKDYLDAREHGAFGSDMVSQEIREEVLQPILDEINKQDMGASNTFLGKIATMGDDGGFLAKARIAGKIADIIWTRAKKIDAGMLKAYQLEDEIFRMAMYQRRRSLGDSPEMAAKGAREQFLDYDIRAPWVNAARNTVLPFVSYTYRAVPMLAQSIAHRPWKLAKYVTLAYIANALPYMWDDGDDGEEKERASLRDEEQGYTWLGIPRMLRMPFRDDQGLPVFLDVRRWIPGGDTFDSQQSNAAIPVPAPLTFGGPIQLAFEFVMNRQAFTGEDITNDLTDDNRDKVDSVASWLWKAWMPSAVWVPNSWYWTKIGNAWDGASDARGNVYSLPQAALGSVGIKVRSQDVEGGLYYHRKDFQRVRSALKSEARALGRQRARNLISQSAYEKGIARIVEKRANLDEKVDEFNRRATPAKIGGSL